MFEDDEQSRGDAALTFHRDRTATRGLAAPSREPARTCIASALMRRCLAAPGAQGALTPFALVVPSLETALTFLALAEPRFESAPTPFALERRRMQTALPRRGTAVTNVDDALTSTLRAS